MNKQYFGNVEERVEFMKGYWEVVQNNTQLGFPVFDKDKAEKAIRKQHARFYGETSKYDGKGNLKEAV